MSAGTILDPITDLSDVDDDPKMAHWFTPPEMVTWAQVNRAPIAALCGKILIPQNDVEGLPLCQKCVVEKERRIAGMTRMN